MRNTFVAARRWLALGAVLLAAGSLLLSAACSPDNYSTPTPEAPEKAARGR